VATSSRANSVRASRRTTAGLARIFAQVGVAGHVRGDIPAAYRTARAAMRQALRKPPITRRQSAAEVMRTLQGAVSSAVVESLNSSAALGISQAEAETGVWGLPFRSQSLQVAPAQAAIMARVAEQAASVDATLALAGWGAGDSILGDGESTLGVLQPAPLLPGVAFWIAEIAGLAFTASMLASTAGTGQEWYKQAVASVDNRTTDCCLKVNGQTVPIEADFLLTGEPRFADSMPWPPFHWYCRTSGVAVPVDFIADDLTDKLLAQSRAELDKRGVLRAEEAQIVASLLREGAAPDAKLRKDDSDSVRKMRARLGQIRRTISGSGGGS